MQGVRQGYPAAVLRLDSRRPGRNCITRRPPRRAESGSVRCLTTRSLAATTVLRTCAGPSSRGIYRKHHLSTQSTSTGSEATFGPGRRTEGVVDHIRKELIEVLEAPDDLKEWVDVIILAFDGAWRTGAGSQEIIDAIKAKQSKNEARQWPDWRTASPGQAIEHIRDTTHCSLEGK